MNALFRQRQLEIIHILGVKPVINPAEEIARRVRFAANYLRRSGNNAFVLGISGGVDSTVSGIMARMATDALTNEGYPAQMIAVRLPYGVQRDEADAQLALQHINPDQVMMINIKPATDGMMDAIDVSDKTPTEVDFIKGNVKARQRMIAQYAIAGANNGLVVGTDHAAEALMGFFTKHGDGGADILMLPGLTKDQVQELAVELGVTADLAYKVPSADLEDLYPGKPDESAFGLTYDEINSFLKGEVLCDSAMQMIISQYNKTEHKRNLPVAYS